MSKASSSVSSLRLTSMIKHSDTTLYSSTATELTVPATTSATDNGSDFEEPSTLTALSITSPSKLMPSSTPSKSYSSSFLASTSHAISSAATPAAPASSRLRPVPMSPTFLISPSAGSPGLAPLVNSTTTQGLVISAANSSPAQVTSQPAFSSQIPEAQNDVPLNITTAASVPVPLNPSNQPPTQIKSSNSISIQSPISSRQPTSLHSSTATTSTTTVIIIARPPPSPQSAPVANSIQQPTSLSPIVIAIITAASIILLAVAIVATTARKRKRAVKRVPPPKDVTRRRNVVLDRRRDSDDAYMADSESRSIREEDAQSETQSGSRLAAAGPLWWPFSNSDVPLSSNSDGIAVSRSSKGVDTDGEDLTNLGGKSRRPSFELMVDRSVDASLDASRAIYTFGPSRLGLLNPLAPVTAEATVQIVDMSDFHGEGMVSYYTDSGDMTVDQAVVAAADGKRLNPKASTGSNSLRRHSKKTSNPSSIVKHITASRPASQSLVDEEHDSVTRQRSMKAEILND
ncbi:hypothetical protein BC830DRAFT_1088253 [Chytriomyces sp. MP71]|nr:hypothetical protein BC830DRAFT_1088253 [Chytriomyces sp. MP71]